MCFPTSTVFSITSRTGTSMISSTMRSSILLLRHQLNDLKDFLHNPGHRHINDLDEGLRLASVFSGSVWTSYVALSCNGCALRSWVGDVAPLPCADTSVVGHPCVVSPCSAVEPPTAFPLCGHWCTVGVLAGTHQCALRCPSKMASGTKRQLCAVLVLVLRRRGTRIRQSGTVEL